MAEFSKSILTIAFLLSATVRYDLVIPFIGNESVIGNLSAEDCQIMREQVMGKGLIAHCNPVPE